jgi:hypothetical protein
LTPEELAWRDLAVYILIDADRNVRVLDKKELQKNVSVEMLFFI